MSSPRTAWVVDALHVEAALTEVCEIYGIRRPQGSNTFHWVGYTFRVVNADGTEFPLLSTYQQQSVYLEWERDIDDAAAVHRYMDFMGNRVPALIRQTLWSILRVRGHPQEPIEPAE